MTLLGRAILLGCIAWYVIGNATWQAENHRQRVHSGATSVPD